MPAARTARITAWNHEQRRGPVDHHVPDVLDHRDAGPLLDFEPQADEVRDLHA
jgi:hypothetical protein